MDEDDNGKFRPERVNTQQTRDIHPILFQCWLTVFDADPTALGECHVFAGITAILRPADDVIVRRLGKC